MENLALKPNDRVLLLGGTGFIGSRLISELSGRNIRLRLLVRNPSKVDDSIRKNRDIEIVKGDLVRGEGLKEAACGIHTAYYLVHSMGGKSMFRNSEFARMDKDAAENFITSADEAGIKRVIYLGGLGETGEGLSEHLRSRTEVAEILSSGKPYTTVLRAAIIIGAGGASFVMLKYLVERLPVMICPKWIDTRIQPIAVKDVLAYLTGCLLNQETAGKTYDIGGPEVLTYREMMQQYTEAVGIPRRIIFRAPVLSPRLAAYWVDLVTPIPSGIAHPLIEGLKNEVICLDDTITKDIPIERTPFKEAVKIAVSEKMK
ncbi:MAG: NAD-dependent epimerase/dehydratase family protein [Candidatus Scalindua sp. AMX11]|nr:MAG: NAD-dependent epimerase/dehydratase family protein [Candidatus Scalindua sp.]NOG84929.1 NAD(P)H-binding protein [Planctomycetota bacterium]RZV84991.1 MAG: NAD-dependent epimerase/dehydratase family protein [Candidatus Scalindua sp. SCAELEC01]TDE63919.1 MAG: NAD-dependent epimerase/dehydratase family protein [Candidatus Scalindua sp. AMX11]GJQ60699.1 MAG: NADH-binding protein [Candidatus Scalindua sp.]